MSNTLESSFIELTYYKTKDPWPRTIAHKEFRYVKLAHIFMRFHLAIILDVRLLLLLLLLLLFYFNLFLPLES